MSTEAEINAAHCRDAVPSKPDQNTRHVGVTMPQDLYDRVRITALRRGVTHAQVVRDALVAIIGGDET